MSKNTAIIHTSQTNLENIMGTRGAYGFTVAGKNKITYNHYDSYPDGLGKTIVEFVACRTPEQLSKIAKAIKMVNENKKITAAQIKKLGTLGITVTADDDWYNVLRDYQGNLEKLSSTGMPYMINSEDFLLDSLFCEWAYIINLDTGMLEFYKGFNENPITEGRFAGVTANRGYYPVKLITEIPLKEIYANDAGDIVASIQKIVELDNTD